MGKIYRISNIGILVFLIITLIHQLFIIYVQGVLFPSRFSPHNLFFTNLIEISYHFTFRSFFFLETINLVLLWLIGKRIFFKNSLILPIIFALSPWGIYLTAAESFYIFLLFLLLLIIYGLILIRENEKRWGNFLIIVPSVIAIYCSFFFLILIPTLFVLMKVFKIFSIKDLKIPIVLIAAFALPIFSLTYNNKPGFKNIINQEINIFSDPGIINNINRFQGEARKDGFGIISKISENKYIFYPEFILLKFIKEITPATFFTSQEKLLNFSANPPILLGFLIPCFFGFYEVLKNSFLRKIALLSSISILPSILSNQIVDLNRLILFAPIIFTLISYGIIIMSKKILLKKIVYFFFTLMIFLVISQLIITILDIKIKEKSRYLLYYKPGSQIGQQ